MISFDSIPTLDQKTTEQELLRIGARRSAPRVVRITLHDSNLDVLSVRDFPLAIEPTESLIQGLCERFAYLTAVFGPLPVDTITALCGPIEVGAHVQPFRDALGAINV